MIEESMPAQPDARDVVSHDDVIVIEIEADRTIGYASIQNAVPVIRSLRVENATNESFEGLQVLVRCKPSFAVGAKLRFAESAVMA